MAFVTRALAKQALQITHSDEDDLIDLMIDAAQEFVGQELGLYFHTGDATVIESLDGGALQLWPTKRPVQSVTSVLDTENDDEAYEFKNDSMRILRKTDGQFWASGSTGIQRWQVTYEAGYGPDDVPATIKQAILDLVVRAYKGRGGKSHQSADGFGFDFAELDSSDILRRCRAYSMKVRIG